MKVTVYGATGSLASTGRKGRNGAADFIRSEFGGSTSCYYVEAGPLRFILDAGSGIAILSDDLLRLKLVGVPFVFLLSHYHWDHIQGFPFFVPAFIKGTTFYIHGHEPVGREKTGSQRNVVEQILSEQQEPPHFPVAHETMPATKFYTAHNRLSSETFYYVHAYGAYTMLPNVGQAENFSAARNFTGVFYPGIDRDPNIAKITTIPLNHPDGCLGYRIEHMTRVFVYGTDSEPQRHTNIQMTRHGKGAHLQVLDGQYTEQQLRTITQGFGHGTPESCVEQAIACRAEKLKVHHFDPKNSDSVLLEMEKDAQTYSANLLSVMRQRGDILPEDNYDLDVQFAREGVTYEV